MTRQGWAGVAAALAALAVGRVFGVVELYVIGAGTAVAVLAGWTAVRLRGPHLTVDRWVHPAVLTVGDTGRVDLSIRNPRRRRSPRVVAVEPVGPRDVARIVVGPLGREEQVDAAYRLPAARRGILEIGPLVLERRDLLGVAVRRRIAAPVIDVVVAPRTHELGMPDLGQGVLGRHLLAQAQRLGTGEFHSLRDYRSGDEMRLVDWKASARSEELKVRQHTTEGVRRCVVVLDLAIAPRRDGRGASPTEPDDEPAECFERAVSAAASLVQSAERAGLTTRFVTAGGIDLRGPEVATTTLRVLARVRPGADVDQIERDPGEGLGLLIVVTRSPATATWRRTESAVDPTLTRVGVFTDGTPDGAGRLSVDASTTARFLATWEALTGRGGHRARTEPVADAGADAGAGARADAGARA